MLQRFLLLSKLEAIVQRRTSRGDSTRPQQRRVLGRIGRLTAHDGRKGDYDAFAQAKDAANKALQIDGAQAQALMVLGVVSFLNDWNPTQSEIFFRRSLDARPGYAMAHALFANTFAHHGKFAEAIEQIKLASAWIRFRYGPLRWHGTYISAPGGTTMLCESSSAQSRSIPSLNLAIGAWALVGSKRASIRKPSRLLMAKIERRRNTKPRNCAKGALPLVERAATGNASWRHS